MSEIHFDGARFSFTDDIGGQRTLLDCRDFLSNKSGISMHRFPQQNFQTIPELIISLGNRQKQLDKELEFCTFLMDTLVCARLIRRMEPFRVLEYGCLKGQISYHLAEILGVFDPRSVLVCAYNTVESEWMEAMERVEHLPCLSLFAGDFGAFQLERDYFDIVLINGMVNFKDPAQVILNAQQLVSKDGVLICLTDHSPLLESTFKLFFENREEYSMGPEGKVLIANAADFCWQEPKKIDLDGRCEKDLEEARRLLSKSTSGRKELLSMVHTLEEDIHEAVRQERTNLKIQLIDQKEMLLTHIF